MGEEDGFIAQLVSYKSLEHFYVYVQVFRQIGHMLPHRLHAFAYQFLVGWGDSPHHVFQVGIEEHCAVYDAFAW